MRWMIVAALLIAAPGAAMAQIPDFLLETDPIFREPPKPYVAPGRIFSINLPDSWEAQVNPAAPETVQLHAVRRNQIGTLQIQHRQVPPGALARQLMLNAIDTRLSKLPGFQEAARRDIKIAGLSGVAVTASYWFQGNIQYPRAIEEVYLVSGSDAFIFHFECFSPVAGAFADDLNTMYTSFVVRPAIVTDTPSVQPLNEPEVEPLPDPGF